MIRQIYVEVIPYDKDFILLALEQGVQCFVVEDKYIDEVKSLARVECIPLSVVKQYYLEKKEDEILYKEEILKDNKKLHVLSQYEVIPVENLLAVQEIKEYVCLTVKNYEQAKTAFGILEYGVQKIYVQIKNIGELQKIITLSQQVESSFLLDIATITKIQPVGLGHRVCIDTLSILEQGQGMLVGNSSAFMFLVHAETEENEYVNARPFRVNAGAVHCYALMPDDKTMYLQEIKEGIEVLIVECSGQCKKAIVGRVKTEIRPMIHLEAKTQNGKIGSIFLQNAETIRLITKDKKPVSIVSLKVGDEILCYLDKAGRHFGMRIDENILE